MAGTNTGGKKAAETNRAKYGDDFYKNIGAIGGKLGRTGGFAAKLLCDCEYAEDTHKQAECAGSKGGQNRWRNKDGQ